MRYVLILLFVAALPCTVRALPKERSDVRAGNRDYKKGNYAAAEIDYRRALDKVAESVNAKYNLGNALLKQLDSLAMQNPDENVKNQLKDIRNYYTPLAEIGDTKLSANAHFNIGNTYLLEQDWKSAAEAYKKALRLNPSDTEAKENLVFAQAMAQNPPQQQQQQQNQDNDNSQNNDDQQNQQQQSDQNQQDQQKQQEQQSNISKDDAQRMLQAMEQQEKDTQEKVKKEKARKAKQRSSDKNW